MIKDDSPASRQAEQGTREKLPICERMVALADDLNLPLGNERRLELREDADTIETLWEMAAALSRAAFTHYRKADGSEGTIEGDDGEMCFIVPHDEMVELRAALSRARNEQVQP